MQLSKNVLSGVLAQGYIGVIGIFMVPFYIKLLGPEAYGLIAFHAVFQTWLQLADFGLTPTISRELSRVRAAAADAMEVQVRVRTMEWVSGSIGLAIAVAVAALARQISDAWLNSGHLPIREVERCVELMGLVIGVRTLSGIYRAGLSGLELMVSLNVASTALATIRAIGVVFVLAFWSPSPVAFFAFQTVIAFLELLVLGAMFYRVVPLRGTRLFPVLASLRELLPVMRGMALLTFLWVLISQTDKLVLSWMLDLRAFGVFMIAATLAGTIQLLVGPVQQSLQAHLSVMVAAGEHTRVVQVFRTCTQVMSAVLFSATAGMWFCAEPILTAWTGDSGIACEGARILPQYAMGGALSGLLGLAFAVQFAYGRLRAHILGNCLFGAVWIPGVFVAAKNGGAATAGWVWFFGNLLFLGLWVPVAIRRIVPGVSWTWLIRDIALPAGIAITSVWMLVRFGLVSGSRWMTLGGFAAIVGVASAVGICSCGSARSAFAKLFRMSFRLQRAGWLCDE